MTKQDGFTLIELMIVVAIIGILAALAIPIMQGNVAKSQLNRVISELSTYRSAFESQLVSSAVINNESLGYVPSELTTGSGAAQIATFNADGSGHIQVTLGGSVHPNLAGTIVRYVRTYDGQWSCELDVISAGGWKAEYRPRGCRVL